MASTTRLSRQTEASTSHVTAVDDLRRIQMSRRRVTFVEARDVTPPYDDQVADPMPRPQRTTTNANSTGRFLSVDQAATQLGMTSARCRRMIRAGQIEAIKIGNRGLWRIERSTIRAVTTAGDVQTPPPRQT